jgi:CheY-like chemotaxis protein
MPNSPKPRILVVDDDARIRESLGMLLMSVGYEVDMANNGAGAVSYLKGSVPDLIVSDLEMPEMSGMRFISQIRTQYPSVLIVAMSGDYRGEGVPASIIADGFYPKGQHPHLLLTAIASLIATRPARRSTDGYRSHLAQDS